MANKVKQVLNHVSDLSSVELQCTLKNPETTNWIFALKYIRF